MKQTISLCLKRVSTTNSFIDSKKLCFYAFKKH